MHTCIAAKLDVKKLACPVLHEFQRDLGRRMGTHFHMTTSACTLARFDVARPIPEVVNSAQTSESSETYKSGSPHKVSEDPQSELHEGEGEI